jgi:hypothetical protein
LPPGPHSLLPVQILRSRAPTRIRQSRTETRQGPEHSRPYALADCRTPPPAATCAGRNGRTHLVPSGSKSSLFVFLSEQVRSTRPIRRREIKDDRLGGSRALLPPRLTNSLLAKCGCKNTAWTFTATTQPPVHLSQVQPRRTTGWYLSLALCFARVDTRFAHNKGSRPAQANGAATWRSATTYETKRAA